MEYQPSLLELPPRDFTRVKIAGPDITPADKKRLQGQLGRVYEATKSGKFMTFDEIGAITGDPAASISARLRQLRGEGLRVDRRRRGSSRSGLWEYSVTDGSRG